MLSHEDHTPGQGQYADVERFIEALVQGGEDRAEATQRVHQRIADAQRTESLRRDNARWMSQLAATGKARLIGHDLDTAEAVDVMIERGGVIAEFPTTLEAAERARERDLFVVAGAPNVLRGGSHSGNVAATELIGRGLVHALASDYLITGLLGAVSLLIQQGIVEPHEAFALITSGAAAAAGLPDRGSSSKGCVLIWRWLIPRQPGCTWSRPFPRNRTRPSPPRSRKHHDAHHPRIRAYDQPIRDGSQRAHPAVGHDGPAATSLHQSRAGSGVSCGGTSGAACVGEL